MEEQGIGEQAGPVVQIRVVSSDRERSGVSRAGVLTPYVVQIIGDTLRRTRPGAWVEVTVPPDVERADLLRLRRQLETLDQFGSEVVVRHQAMT